MKQTLTALLLALTMLLGLTGCTSKKDNGTKDDTLGNNTLQNDGSMNNNGNTNNGTANGGTNGGTDSDTNNSTNNGTARSGNDGFMGSRSYDQMLRDGRVHDTDGDLTDGENSVSDW